MEKQDKKKDQDAVDEQYIMSLMAGDIRTDKTAIADEAENKSAKTLTPAEPSFVKKSSAEKSRSKKTALKNYDSQFLQVHNMTKRGDKTIYVRPEYHERMNRIVQVIGQDRIPLYAYLDNILEHHFSIFEQEIIEDFNQNFKPLF